MNVFVLAILIYVLYRFIAGFLIPVFRTSRAMREQFNNINKNGGERNGQSGGQNTSDTSKNADNPNNSGSSKVGEYIDFEEIHD